MTVESVTAATRVKRLQWTELGGEYTYKSSIYRESTAASVVGSYIIRYRRPAPKPDRGYPTLAYDPCFTLSGPTNGDNFDTLEEAQAGAQADFERRILSALQPAKGGEP